jgi:predicted enzyme related to lactoylglutathione lyase
MNGIGIKEAAFTGYPATDLSAARRFYGEILGLPEGTVFEHDGEVGWVEYSIPGGHTLAITKASEQWQPSAHGGGLCLEVEDLDAAVLKLEQAGVTIALPIQDYPVCRLALIADPSGNTIALHQKKANHPECSC